MPSTSPAQHRLMEAAAHTKGGYGGVSQKVGKEFVAKDAEEPTLAELKAKLKGLVERGHGSGLTAREIKTKIKTKTMLGEGKKADSQTKDCMVDADVTTGILQRCDALGRRLDAMERADAEERVAARKDAIEVEGVNNYEFTHGKKPSGKGNWAFEFDGKVHFAPSGKTFTEAKAWAQQKAKELGASRIKVGT